MNRGRDICERFNKGETFGRMSDKRDFGKIRVNHPSELAANSKLLQDMIKKHSRYFDKNKNRS